VLGALAAATVVVLGVELLSLVGWVRLGPMAALAVLSARALAAVYRSEAPEGRGSANADRLSRELVGNLVLIAASTPVTAVVAPPNSWDSMTYHLSRVAHWGCQRERAPLRDLDRSPALGASLRGISRSAHLRRVGT